MPAKTTTTPAKLSDEAKPFATTTLKPTRGHQTTGSAIFSESPEGLRIKISVNNAPPGDLGIHIHEKGDCSAPDASSAGDHWNPGSTAHGAPNQKPSHAGDLGNITVSEDGAGVLTMVLRSDAHAAVDGWQKVVGKSMVLHAGPDDFTSQPSGNSGSRIACGVIEEAGKKTAH